MPKLSRLPTGVKVRLRKMRFPLEDGVPQHWVENSPFITHFFNALSTVFPEGEKFFIESVRNFERQVSDPELREQIREFARQEGHHTLQHRLLNEIVARQGQPIASYEQMLREILDHARAQHSDIRRLAVTCSLEHLTALLGGLVLEHPEVLAGMDARLRPLWLWHAVEETEHKAVAFDVYTAVGGDYATRVAAMMQATLLFFTVVHSIQLRMLMHDPGAFRARDLLAGLDFLWGRRGFMRRIVPGYLRWFRPDFHPWDDDNSALIEAWKRDNAQYIADTQAEPAAA